VLAAEHLLDLAGLDLLIQRLERLRELGVDRLTRFRPLHQNGEILALPLERAHQIAILFKSSPALQDPLGLGLIVPEIRRRSSSFEAAQFFVGFRPLKDNSADRRRVC
jgi:hypothetical protein